MNTTLQAQKILDHAVAENLYNDVILQINKDFARAAVDEHFASETEPRSLVRRLVALLFELITTNFESYLNLLYTIDVPEQRIKQLPEQEIDKIAQAVAVLILKREWQKVQFKNRY